MCTYISLTNLFLLSLVIITVHIYKVYINIYASLIHYIAIYYYYIIYI